MTREAADLAPLITGILAALTSALWTAQLPAKVLARIYRARHRA